MVVAEKLLPSIAVVRKRVIVNESGREGAGGKGEEVTWGEMMHTSSLYIGNGARLSVIERRDMGSIRVTNDAMKRRASTRVFAERVKSRQ